MTDCVFCDRIKRGEYEAWAAAPSVVWFEPLNPVTPGHVLFVPVHHVTGAGDPRNGPYETAITMEVAARWAQRNGVESFNLITSVGGEATQSVRHLHAHLLPRRAGDGLHLPWTGQAEREGREKSPAVRLLEEALHLRMNGERAPGGNETWHDWDLRAETFLRSLLPEPDAG